MWRLRLLVVLSASLASACAGPERVIRVGERIHHDDFEYSVTRVRTMPSIGGRQASGRYVVVTFRVDNHARRVAHEWSNRTAYVVDGSGREFENNVTAQRALAAQERVDYKETYRTLAGDHESTDLVFDVPSEAKEPMLKVRGDILMGDVFDLDQFARTKIRLF
jgi:hypothetical protein